MIAHYSLPPEGNLKINESFKEMFGFISLIGLPTDQILIAHLRAKFMDSQKIVGRDRNSDKVQTHAALRCCCIQQILVDQAVRPREHTTGLAAVWGMFTSEEESITYFMSRRCVNQITVSSIFLNN